MDPLEFEKTAIRMLADILQNVPFLRINKPRGPFRQEGQIFPLDGLIRVEFKDGHERLRARYLVLEVKQSAQMRDVEPAIDRIERFARMMGAEPGYGVFASQYLPQSVKNYCKGRGVGYFDLSGNCFLNFDQVYIERDVPLTIAPEKKRLRSLFSDKSARVIRRLLENPDSTWRVQGLALNAHVSKATVSLLKDKLVEGSYAISHEDSSFALLKPEELLRDWARHYSSHEHVQLECYGRGELVDNEKAFSSYCMQNELAYGFTLFSAARRVAPFTRGISRSHAFVVSDKSLQELADELEFKTVESGGNFRLIAPTDDDVLYGSYWFEQEVLVSDIQLYLDLACHKGRGEENAEFLLDTRIKKRWPDNLK